MDNVESLYQQRRYVECENTCRSLLLANPKNIEVRNTLIMALEAQGKLRAASSECENLLSGLITDSDKLNLLEYQGSLNATTGDYESAAKSYSRALEIDKTRTNTWIALGSCQYEINDYEACTKSILNGINAPEIDEIRYCEALYFLTESNSSLTYAETIKITPRAKQPIESAQYYFSIANLFERQGDYKDALAAYDRGNQLLRERRPYNSQQEIRTVSSYLRILTNQDILDACLPLTDELPIPIFILGMPRTGSSLLEQILGRHSKISPQGEAKWLPDAFVKHLGSVESETEFKARCLSPEFVSSIRKTYLDHVKSASTPFITDKLPGNFAFMFLIKLAFPQAFVVKTNRNRLATIWSCYKTPIWNGHSYTHSLEETADYFDLVETATAQWGTLFNDRFIEVSYESLTDDAEDVVGQLFSDLNLDFEEDCFNHESSTRVIKTASKNQVTKPIYRDANESSRNFERYISNRIPN